MAFSLNADPVVAAEAVRAWVSARGLGGVTPAFVQVFGLSTSDDTGYEVRLAERFRDEVLPLVVPSTVIVDAFQGTRRDYDGVDLLWYIAEC